MTDKKEEEPTTALTIPNSADESAFAVISDPDAAGVLVEMIEDLGGKVDPFELPRIGVPQGKGTAFEITGEDPKKTIDVVVAAMFLNTFAYWSQSYEAGTPGPPNCQSRDGVHGYGVRAPYGTETPDSAEPSKQFCEECHMGAFGSALLPGGKPKKAQPKACRQGGQLFVFPLDSQVPHVILVSPASVPQVRQLVMDCGKKGGSIRKAVVRLSLTPETNADGIQYARIKGEFLRKLSAEEQERLGVIANAMRAKGPVDVVQGEI